MDEKKYYVYVKPYHILKKYLMNEMYYMWKKYRRKETYNKVTTSSTTQSSAKTKNCKIPKTKNWQKTIWSTTRTEEARRQAAFASACTTGAFLHVYIARLGTCMPIREGV